MKVGQTFSSFSEFEAELRRIKVEGNHILRMFNSQSAKDYNRKRSPTQLLVDENQFQYTYYSARCVHYGEPRCRGKGVRSHRRSFALGCPVKITASHDKFQRKLKVNHCVLKHSHRTSKNIIKHYPSERKLAKDQESDI